jgi:hypothetical protein
MRGGMALSRESWKGKMKAPDEHTVECMILVPITDMSREKGRFFSRVSEEKVVCSLFNFLQSKPGQASHAANEVAITKNPPKGGFHRGSEMLVAFTGT